MKYIPAILSLIFILLVTFIAVRFPQTDQKPAPVKREDLQINQRDSEKIEAEVETELVKPVEPNIQPIPSLTEALKAKSIEEGAPIFIRIFKKSRELELWAKNDVEFDLIKTYPICAYSGYLGPKLKEGDHQSPEGFYFVTASAMNPNSSYHLSFNLGFPNAYDRSHGRTGSYLMVHGDCLSVGCYAMTDEGIEEIYSMADSALNNGQRFFRVHIFPFRMTEENMALHQTSPWIGFWQNLKVGYDHFEKYKLPPDVTVENKTYIIAHDG